MKRCVNKLGLFVLIFIILISLNIVFAQNETTADFDEENSYVWLKANTENWDSLTIPEVSLAILTLNNKGEDSIIGVNNLFSRIDSDYCWPVGGCTVTDTALATLALYYSGQDATKSIEWLQNKNETLKPALTTGNWLIQIEVPTNASCILTFGNNETKTFSVKGNKITPSSNNLWIDVERDLKAGLISNKVSEKVNVDCGNAANILISLLYKTGNNIYILEGHRQSGTLTINNGCYAATKSGGVCDYSSTMYASWALREMNQEIATIAYLDSQIPDGILEHSFFGRITKRPSYLDFLKDEQETIGGWSTGNFYTTAFTVFALASNRNYYDTETKGTNFLKDKVTDNGNWGGVRDTSMVLIALHGGLEKIIAKTQANVTNVITIPETCNNKLDDDSDKLIDCLDGDCKDSSYCAESPKVEEVCNLDGKCGSSEDCDCSDCTENTKCKKEEAKAECSADDDCDNGKICQDGKCIKEEKKKSSLGLIIAIIIILLIIVGGVFFYFKYVRTGKFSFKKKPAEKKIPEYQKYGLQTPLQTVQRPVQPTRKLKEDELEKSLQKAEKMLYGK